METLNNSLLITLLDMAQNDVPASVNSLAKEHHITRAQVAIGLNVLAEQGLVRAETIRLTFVGLMRATGLRAQHYGQKGAAA